MYDITTTRYGHLNEKLTGRILDVYPGSHEDNNDGNEFFWMIVINALMENTSLISKVDFSNCNLVNIFKRTPGSLQQLLWNPATIHITKEHCPTLMCLP